MSYGLVDRMKSNGLPFEFNRECYYSDLLSILVIVAQKFSGSQNTSGYSFQDNPSIRENSLCIMISYIHP